MFAYKESKIICPICRRETPEAYIEKHHLVPRVKHGKETIDVCCDCGDQLHNIFSIKELEYIYNTLETILANERVKTWIRWIRKKKEFGTVCMKEKK